MKTIEEIRKMSPGIEKYNAYKELKEMKSGKQTFTSKIRNPFIRK